MPNDILWLSPTDFVTGDNSLRISYPSVTHPTVEITASTPGDLKWVYLGLKLPLYSDIHAIHVGYQLSNRRSFIAQVRLAEMGTPDHAAVHHDDGTNLLSTGPTSYRSQLAAGYRPDGAVTLQLRLNFQNVGDTITLGAIGVEVEVRSTILLPTYTLGTRPAPGNPGSLVRITDGIRGLYLDTGTTWAHLFGGVVDVKRDFGAIGDNSADDGPALAAAIIAVAAQGGGIVALPPATYRIDQDIPVPAGVTLEFQPRAKLNMMAGRVITFTGGLLADHNEQIFTEQSRVVLPVGRRITQSRPEWWGAMPDGTTNCRAGIECAMAALTGGGVVQLGPGTYLVRDAPGSGVRLNYSNIVLKGSGTQTTHIKGSGTTTYVLLSQLAADNITLRDFTVDGNNTTTACIALDGSDIRGLRIENVHFTNFHSGYGVIAQWLAQAAIYDCYFYSLQPGSSRGTGILLGSGTHDVVIERGKFWYLNNGILVDTGASSLDPRAYDGLATDIAVRNCYFEGGWWLLPIRDTHSGRPGTATTYTDTTLQHDTANFPSITPLSQVRLMHRVRQGAVSRAKATFLQDNDALFTSAGLLAGHIVRTTNGKFAVVSAVESDTILRVEEWLDDTTRQPVPPPAAATTYAVYRVFLGRRHDNIATSITVQRWFDLDGATVTGSTLNSLSDLTYELLPDHMGHSGIHCEANAYNIEIGNCIFKRSWGDQLSMQGNRGRIHDNYIYGAQDMGITVNGQVSGGGRSLISNNIVEHSGSGGISCAGEDCSIIGNQVTDTHWVNNNPSDYASGIDADRSRILVANNVIDGLKKTGSRFGISMSGENIVCVGNICRNHTEPPEAAGIRVRAAARNEKVWDNDCSGENLEITQGGIAGGWYKHTGNGDPTILASPGSMWFRRDGGAGTSLYIKETMATSREWTAK